MDNIINYIPKPLLEDIADNMVVPMIGAGFSKNAITPKELVMPDWHGLASNISKYLDDYEFTNPIDTLSIYEKEYSRNRLVETLAKELLINEILPGKTHEAFCRLLFDIIVTTNFDFLLEKTLEKSKIPYCSICEEESLPLKFDVTTKIIKLHGDFNHPTKMVITEHDYDCFLDKNPILATYLSSIFITKTLLLIGYSFDDPDMRLLWQIINSRLGNLNRLAYCILVNASKIEISRFERRNIKVINLPGDKKDYTQILERTFVAIKEYVDPIVQSKIILINDRATEEMKLPDDENRLCFISAPYNRLLQIREFIYPALYECNITPISLEEVISQGDNMQKIVESLITKSHFCIIDLSEDNPNVQYEYLYSLKVENKIIISIAEKNSPLPSYAKEKLVIFYENSALGMLSLQKNIAEQLTKYNINGNYFQIEYKRLFDKGEYTASVISAYRLLEEKAKIFLDLTWNNYRETPDKKNLYHMSLYGMLVFLLKEKIIDIDISDVEKISKSRNAIIHSTANISKQEALDTLLLVEKIIDKLTNESSQGVTQ